MRRQTQVAIGVLMMVIGALWCIQGLGWLSGSEVMSGHPVWAVVGGVLLLLGVVQTVRAARGPDKPPMWSSLQRPPDQRPSDQDPTDQDRSEADRPEDRP